MEKSGNNTALLRTTLGYNVLRKKDYGMDGLPDSEVEDKGSEVRVNMERILHGTF